MAVAKRPVVLATGGRRTWMMAFDDIGVKIAAAIAYGLDKIDGEENIIVFDLGGNTFDVSLLIIDNGLFEVLKTGGDTHLGGEVFDQTVMDYFMKLIKKKTGRDVRADTRAVQKLRQEVEKGNHALSTTHQTVIEVESLFEGYDFRETLSRAKFEELNIELFLSTLRSIQMVLEDTDMKYQDVDEIVLVGGSTRIPKVQELVEQFFGGKKPIDRGINPDESVAYGAAVQGGILRGVDNDNPAHTLRHADVAMTLGFSHDVSDQYPTSD